MSEESTTSQEETTEENQEGHIYLSSKQTQIFSSLVRLPPSAKEEYITRIALKSPHLCKLVIRSLFRKNRPSSITPPLIHKSIIQLGQAKVRKMFVAHCLKNAFSRAVLKDFDIDSFWRNSIRRGFLAQELAERMFYKDLSEAFIVGLCLELGSLLYALRYPNYTEQIYQLLSRPSDYRMAMEPILFGQTHAEELETSGFSEILSLPILQAISSHQSPEVGEDRQNQLTQIAYLTAVFSDITLSSSKSRALELLNKGWKRYMPDDKKRLNAKRDRIKALFDDDEMDEDTAKRAAKAAAKQEKIYTEIFNNAEEKTLDLCSVLGLESTKPLSFQQLINGGRRSSNQDYVSELPSSRQIDDRMTFRTRIQQALKERYSDEVFSIIMIHVDNFGKVNESYGYPTGDQILRLISQKISAAMRNSDVVAHIQGDCFAIFLTDTPQTGGKIVGERVRSMVKQGALSIGSLRLNLSVSIGGVTVDNHRPYYENTFEDDSSGGFGGFGTFSGFSGFGDDDEEEDDDLFFEDDGSIDALNDLLKDLNVAVAKAKKEGRNRVSWIR